MLTPALDCAQRRQDLSDALTACFCYECCTPLSVERAQLHYRCAFADRYFVVGEPVQSGDHLGEHPGVKPSVDPGGTSQEDLLAGPFGENSDVYEVACRCAIEFSELDKKYRYVIVHSERARWVLVRQAG
jgi:hypothetical protein